MQELLCLDLATEGTLISLQESEENESESDMLNNSLNSHPIELLLLGTLEMILKCLETLISEF